MRKVFEETPFQVLNTLFNDTTAYLFGTDAECLRTLVQQCTKYNWITLLGVNILKL